MSNYEQNLKAKPTRKKLDNLQEVACGWKPKQQKTQQSPKHTHWEWSRWWLNHPFEQYWSNWIISPTRGENKKIFETTT